MAADRETPTLADYAVTALSPALIMALVGSLTFFLIEVCYAGQYTGRLMWTLFFFVFATVLVSRIAIEMHKGLAAAYGLALAFATFLALVKFVDYPADSGLAAWGPRCSAESGAGRVTFKGTDGIGVACSGSRELVFTNHAFVAVHLAFHPILEDARLFRQQPKNLEAAAARAFLVPIGREAHGLPDGKFV